MQLVGLRVGFKEFGDDFFGDEFHEGSGLRELLGGVPFTPEKATHDFAPCSDPQGLGSRAEGRKESSFEKH